MFLVALFFFCGGETVRSSLHDLVITNNPLVARCLPETYSVQLWEQLNYEQILIKVRDCVYAGHRLYTHPLAGSVKPNETPYRSVVISRTGEDFSCDDAALIASAIETFGKFTPRHRELTEEMLWDFQLVDYSLLCAALEIDPLEGLHHKNETNYRTRRCSL